MNTVTFLEKLANNTHHSAILHKLINNQSEVVKKALETNDVALLRKQFASIDFLADVETVVQG